MDAGGNPEALTERETEVLRLVARGKRNREIADELGVTERTVKYHTANIFAKLGVRSRAEAIALAWKEARGPASEMRRLGLY